MLVDELNNLNVATKIVENNRDSNIAYAIKNSKGQVVTCNQMFLECTGINDIKSLQGLGDKDIKLWKDNICDYAIGEKFLLVLKHTTYLPNIYLCKTTQLKRQS